MGVSVGKDAAHAERRQAVFVPAVAVGEEEALAVCVENGVVRHHRKLEHHLIDLGVAVAADGEDAVLAAVENGGDLYGVVEVGHAVARSVIQEIAQKDEPVVTDRVGPGESCFERGRNTVDVAHENDLHGDDYTKSD